MNFNKLNENDLIVMGNKLKNMKEEEQKYIELYFAYRKLFTEYIINKLELQEYDKKIRNSKLKFKINKVAEIDSYQYFCFKELKYFYIRNNVYIEKLTNKEKKYLQDKIDNEDYELDSKASDFIENTYKKVAFRDILGNGKQCIIFYGPLSNRFAVPNDNIVLGFRYDEFNENGLDDNSWKQLHTKQLEFLKEIVDEIQKKSDNISIIKYNEFSVIPRKIALSKNNNKNKEEE